MAEDRQPRGSFPARAKAGARGADHIAFIDGFVEERKDHVSSRRNSINKHTKSQPTIPLMLPYDYSVPSPASKSHLGIPELPHQSP